jgi:hypothetical protein
LSHEYVRPAGPPPGFRPIHLLYGAAFVVVWVLLLVFVLTKGHADRSSVDVYSELPPAFTNELAAKGVLYQGLSPVDSATVDQVLAHASAGGAIAPGGSNPIVLKTSFSDEAKGYRDQAALMVVVPDARSSSGTSAVYVAFLDPTSYRTLASLSYATSGGASSAPSSGSSSASG